MHEGLDALGITLVQALEDPFFGPIFVDHAPPSEADEFPTSSESVVTHLPVMFLTTQKSTDESMSTRM